MTKVMNFDMDTMRDELIRDEDVRLRPYKDTVGKTTIGAGRNLDDVGISRTEALYLLDNDIYRSAGALDISLPWWQNLDPVRQRVLLNMCFNLGITKLLGFKNTLAFMRAGEYEKAAKEMIESKWAGQVGGRALRLASMMRDGK